MAEDIVQWLEGLGLGRYAQVFTESRIDLDVLTDLTDADLKDLDIPLGDRKRLLRGIAELSGRPAAESARESAASLLAAAPQQAERRQLTVLFCDIVGSTALSARLDPEDMREVLRAYQETCSRAIARFDGYVAKFMGDGVYAYFGYPEAHEDDAARAIHAGLEIVETVSALERGLAVRIGVATGTVAVGDIVGEGASEEAAIVGEAPNLAARLQELAAPNTVVVSDATQTLAGALFETADLGRHRLKGFEPEARVWSVVRPRRIESRFAATHRGRLTELVGRDEEMEILVRRWDRAKGGEGQVVLVAGEPGIGKSRLVRALEQRIAGEPHFQLRYQCSPYHANSALYPVIDQLERAAEFETTDSPEIRLSKTERLLSMSGQPIENVMPLIAALLSVPAGNRYEPINVSPERQKQLTLQALIEQLSGLASRQPTLFVFEDIHWVDPTTLDLLEQVVERVPQLPILAIITHRSEFQAPWIGRARVTPIILGRLERRDCERLIERVAGATKLQSDLFARIADQTDGVPLFVEELTRTVLESGMAATLGSANRAPAAFALEIPTTLRDSLMARLDRLGPVKEIAQIGAAIGREFGYRLLAEVAGDNVNGLDEAIEQLVEAGLVLRRGSGPEAAYVFKHAMVQETAYDMLLKSRRREFHRRIASALETSFPQTVEAAPEILARHLTDAGLAERAVEYWQKAGERAAGRSANAEAINHFDQALTLLAAMPADADRDARELDLRLLLGSSQLMAKGHGVPEVEDAYNRALALSRNAAEASKRVRALFGLWRYYIVVPDFDVCRELANQLLEIGARNGDRIAQVLAHYAMGATELFVGDLEAARGSLDRGIAVYDLSQRSFPAFTQGQDPAEACLVYRGLAQWLLGFPESAVASSDAGVAHAQEIGDPFSEGHARLFHAMLDILRNDLASLERHAARTVSLSEEHGFSGWSNAGKLYCDWLEALDDPSFDGDRLRESAKLWSSVASDIFAPVNLMLIARLEASAGRYDAALIEIDGALELSATTNEKWWDAELLRLRAGFLLARGDPTGAVEDGLWRAVEKARAQNARSLELRAAIDLAKLRHGRGDTRGARELLEPVHGWFTEGFDTDDLKAAQALLQDMSGAP